MSRIIVEKDVLLHPLAGTSGRSARCASAYHDDADVLLLCSMRSRYGHTRDTRLMSIGCEYAQEIKMMMLVDMWCLLYFARVDWQKRKSARGIRFLTEPPMINDSPKCW